VVQSLKKYNKANDNANIIEKSRKCILEVNKFRTAQIEIAYKGFNNKKDATTIEFDGKLISLF